MEENDCFLKNILKSEIMKENKIRKIQQKINKKEEKINEFIQDRKEGIKRELMYYYWCKAEHEVMVTDLFPRNYEDFQEQAVKIDIWYQLEPNLDRIVEYVIKNLNIEF